MLRLLQSTPRTPSTFLKPPGGACFQPGYSICRLYATGDHKKPKKRTKTIKSETKGKKKAKTVKGEKGMTEMAKDLSLEPVDVEMPPKSTVSVGTQFELRAQSLLRERFSMSLERTAGPGDGGLDLVGWWWLPCDTAPSSTGNPETFDEDGTANRWRIRVLAQCKAEKKPFGPSYVREMEGVLHRHFFPRAVMSPLAPSEEQVAQTYHPKSLPILAMLVSLSPFTSKAISRAMSSPIPFLLLHLPKEPDPSAEQAAEGERAPSLLWNSALGSENGLLRGRLEVRWEVTDAGAQPVLWWDGRPLPPMVPVP
ncbi:SubName: Full=Uncharacterized protein {ECO:0000313/EMBL:CCA72038.1} [Serendipita indica DSM 11827]|uniref:Required for respiratory growth protein 7, mitochondrial n=1 Tax=Serendipita indica (strain DSM 11827) TaxID=1109443 RepID=G4TL40_SERID|nr:SubName: Full=Uncharacterized protein {ECO:0000313/EMBL:CCA72038.1} [Serendipita indica DSM 11827]CCA72038.1 hypothetical protein PIIN_05973 [Serendipita indica DSM 11827]